MGVFSAWNNHRARQSGKYAKVMAQQQQAASMSVLPPPVYPQPTQPGGGFKDGYDRGYKAGWREGQKDLVEAVRSGRLAWDEAVQRLT